MGGEPRSATAAGRNGRLMQKLQLSCWSGHLPQASAGIYSDRLRLGDGRRKGLCAEPCRCQLGWVVSDRGASLNSVTWLSDIKVEGFAMQASEIERNSVLSFANDWISQNIEVGPFSCDDAGIYDDPIRQFRKEASKAGLDEGRLERAIGPVPAFIASAFSKAASAWLASAEARRRCEEIHDELPDASLHNAKTPKHQ